MAQEYQPLPNGFPRHVGIIMDGNGRWAKRRGLTRNMGHKQGAKVFGDIVRHASSIGLGYLTVYAFSTENWKRSSEEVQGIMSLLRSYLRDMDRYRKENIRVRILGDTGPLDADIREMIAVLEQNSRNNTGLHLNIAINYGGQDELVRAARLIAEQVRDRELRAEDVDKDMLAAHLYTAGQPDTDLIIRTSGEYRISNFLLWQSAYAEFVFSDVLWPDFGPAEFDAALEEFAARSRRMGGA